jgi:hypothetical protein
MKRRWRGRSSVRTREAACAQYWNKRRSFHRRRSVGRVVGAQAAPEDEEVGARDCTRWIELKAAEVADGLEDAVRAIAGETLARDREPARGP